MSEPQDEFDVIVVGAGSSGAVLASRLSEDPGRAVLLLEAGEIYRDLRDFPDAVLDPSDISAAMPGSSTNWSLVGSLLPGTQTPVPRGKGMGGSSSVNGCYFMRAVPANFAEWVALGNDEWSYEAVLPYFTRSESDRDFGGSHHGSDGPIVVTREPSDRAAEFTEAFARSCTELGFAEEPDKNAGGQSGVGPVPLNIADGRRQSTGLTYLLPALSRPNLTVVGGATVLRLVLSQGRCVGVEVDVAGTSKVYRANETVVAAGALRTPQLLMISGIGPAAHLREKDIAVIADLPGVGQNLMDHPELTMQWQTTRSIPAMSNRGFFTSALNWTSEGSSDTDDLEILPVVTTAADMMKVGSMAKRPIKTLGAIRQASAKYIVNQARAARHPFTVVTLQQEESRGSVILASADPRANPVLNWNLLSTASDRQRFREAVRVARSIFSASPLREIGTKLVNLDDRDLKSDDTVDRWVRDHIFAVGHPSCTCKMGPESDRNAVVDQFGRVRGVVGLRIADTSIFPKNPSRGHNATAVMVGERISSFITS